MKRDKGPYSLSVLFIAGASIAVPVASSHAHGATANDDDVRFEQKIDRMKKSMANNRQLSEVVIKKLRAEREKVKHYRANPKELEAELMNYVRRMRELNTATTVSEFIEQPMALEDKLIWCEENDALPSADIMNKIAEEVIEIYAKRRIFFKDEDSFPVIIAAKYGSSPALKKYLMGFLKGPERPDRQVALEGLARTVRLKGDPDIYSAVEAIHKAGPRRKLVLSVMVRIDRERALPFVINEVGLAKDEHRFNQVAGLLSTYGRVELLEHALKRIRDFPQRSWDDPRNPTLGIPEKMLLQYIEEAEGERLEAALAALKQSVLALRDSGPVLKMRLKSNDVQTRRAVARFLSQASNFSQFRRPDIIDEIENAARAETNAETRREMDAAAKRLRAKELSEDDQE